VGRLTSIAGLSLIIALAGIPLAQAGIPRGAILIADEQDADPETGVTIARGNAEIKFDKQPIAGHADSIELNPASNQIVFKGRAVLSVGRDHFKARQSLAVLISASARLVQLLWFKLCQYRRRYRCRLMRRLSIRDRSIATLGQVQPLKCGQN
jgi:LptA/(LptD N-terminal domain) LPS transport protein